MDIQQYLREKIDEMFLGRIINIEIDDFSCDVCVREVNNDADLIILTADNDISTCEIKICCFSSYQYDLGTWYKYQIRFKYDKTKPGYVYHKCNELNVVV